MKPMVSIIMPVYNAQRYLRETVESVMAQTFQEFEVLAVNDGSTDESLKILQEYAEQDERIRIIDKENSGVSDTRNVGIAQAKGEYLAFLDADDLLSPEYLAVMADAAQRTGADMLVCNYVPFHSAKNCFSKEKTDSFYPVRDEKELLDSGRMTAIWTKMISAVLIRRYKITFDTEMTFGEDLFFCWRAYIAAQNVFMTDRRLYGYRMGTQGATGRYHPKLYESYRAAVEELKAFSKENNCLTDERRLAIDIYFTKRIPTLVMMTARKRTSVLKKRERIDEILRDEIIQNVLKKHWDKLTAGEPEKMVKLYCNARAGRTGKLLMYGYKMELRSRLSRLKTKIVG